MSYLRQRKNKRKRISIFIGVLVFFVLLTLSFYINHSFFSGAAHSVAGPFWRVSERVAEEISSVSPFFAFKSSVVIENKELKQRVADLEKDSIDKHALRFENRELRENLNMKPKQEAVMTYVMARPPRVPYDVLVIDGGKDLGFSVGDKVFWGESVLLGEIRDVYGKTSLVVLYSSSGESVDVYIEDGEDIFVTVGRGGGKFVLEVPRKSDISEEDFIFKIENGISLLAEVVTVTIPETGANKIVTARTPVDIFSLKTVFVVSGSEI